MTWRGRSSEKHGRPQQGWDESRRGSRTLGWAAAAWGDLENAESTAPCRSHTARGMPGPRGEHSRKRFLAIAVVAELYPIQAAAFRQAAGLLGGRLELRGESFHAGSLEKVLRELSFKSQRVGGQRGGGRAPWLVPSRAWE